MMNKNIFYLKEWNTNIFELLKKVSNDKWQLISFDEELWNYEIDDFLHNLNISNLNVFIYKKYLKMLDDWADIECKLANQYINFFRIFCTKEEILHSNTSLTKCNFDFLKKLCFSIFEENKNDFFINWESFGDCKNFLIFINQINSKNEIDQILKKIPNSGNVVFLFKDNLKKDVVKEFHELKNVIQIKNHFLVDKNLFNLFSENKYKKTLFLFENQALFDQFLDLKDSFEFSTPEKSFNCYQFLEFKKLIFLFYFANQKIIKFNFSDIELFLDKLNLTCENIEKLREEKNQKKRYLYLKEISNNNKSVKKFLNLIEKLSVFLCKNFEKENSSISFSRLDERLLKEFSKLGILEIFDQNLFTDTCYSLEIYAEKYLNSFSNYADFLFFLNFIFWKIKIFGCKTNLEICYIRDIIWIFNKYENVYWVK